MQNLFFFLMFWCAAGVLNAQPNSFVAKGIGGGGALFSPSINPDDHNEFYVSCDMGELFRTTSFGAAYSQINFSEVLAGPYTRINFTNTPGLLYTIRYNNDEIPTAAKSTDNGQTWTTLAGNPDSSENTYSLFVDYSNPNRILISYYNSIYFSGDGGNTFTHIHNADDNNAGVVVGGVFFDSNNIYIGTNDGVIVSTNGGNSWGIANITGLPGTQRIWSFAAAKSGNTTRFFCITADVNDLYQGVVGSDYWGFAKGIYAVDFGSGNWLSKSNGLNFNQDFPMFVAMANHNIETIYLAGSQSNSFPDIIKSTDGGSTWTHVFNTVHNQNINTGWSGSGGDRGWGYGECPFGFDVADTDPNILIFSDFGFVHTSQNGGMTWSQAYIAPSDENPAGTDTPPFQYYQSVGIENTSNWQVHWSDANKMWACFSDIRGIRSNDKGDKWSFDYTGHTANTSYRIAHLTNGTLIMGTSNIHDIYQSTYLQDSKLDTHDPNGKIIYSTNNGQTWQNLKIFNHPVYWVAVDPNNQNIAYASVIHYANGSGIGGIYKTENLNLLASSSWTLLSDPPRTQKHPACIQVLNDGNIVCTYSGRRTTGGSFTQSSGVFYYNNTNAVWTDVSHSGMHYWTKDIIIDPNDAAQNTWYVGVFSGWGGAPNGLGGLYKTTNRGQSWIKLTGNTLDRVHSCTFNPLNLNQIFITTEAQGLWYCNNINDVNPIFVQVNSYPFQQPVRVFFNPYDSSEMWVSSFGNGLKKAKIYPSNCNIVVNTNNDGIGSLRYALECTSGGDTIFFAHTLADQIIQITGEPISIDKSITIQNQNNNTVTVRHSDGNLFEIQPDKNVWIENVHLQTSATGTTCISNRGHLTLKNISTSVTNNTHSKIMNFGSGTVQLIGTNQIR